MAAEDPNNPRHSDHPPIKKRAPPPPLPAHNTLLLLLLVAELREQTETEEMPSMERSVSMAERATAYGGPADLRSYSASYAPRVAPPGNKVMSRARSTAGATAWSASRPAAQRSGSVKPVSGSGGGVNLRSYSASYAASYGPTLAGGGDGGGQLKRSGSVTSWSASGRRSVNLRGYTPSFAALDDTAAAPAPAPAPAKKQVGIDDAELQRKKRLVVYKVYDVEGKLRSSVRRGVGWIKSKCSRVVYGFW